MSPYPTLVEKVSTTSDSWNQNTLTSLIPQDQPEPHSYNMIPLDHLRASTAAISISQDWLTTTIPLITSDPQLLQFAIPQDRLTTTSLIRGIQLLQRTTSWSSLDHWNFHNCTSHIATDWELKGSSLVCETKKDLKRESVEILLRNSQRLEVLKLL